MFFIKIYFCGDVIYNRGPIDVENGILSKKFESSLHLLTEQEQMTGQEITEVILQFLLNAILQLLHLAICLLKARTEVSFPDFLFFSSLLKSLFSVHAR